MGRETWEAKPKFSFSFLGTLQIPRGNSVWEKEELVMCVVALGSESEQEREREKGTKGYSKTQHDKAYSFVVLMI